MEVIMQIKIAVLVLGIVAGSCTDLNAMHRLKKYTCLLFKCSECKKVEDLPSPTKLPNELPEIVHAFNEFVCEDNIPGGGKRDVQEFDVSYKWGRHLDEKCMELHEMRKKHEQKEKYPLSPKDNALLNFAYTMANHEKEWVAWHTEALISEKSKELSQHEFSLPTGGSHKSGLLKGKPISTRQDYKSPFYKAGRFTNDMHRTLSGTETIVLTSINALENTAYHDELKFLQTQLHKMELYWNMKPSSWSKFFQKHTYNQMYGTLKKEIELFKSDAARTAFTRSCMRKNDFQKIQSMRNAYTESQQKGGGEL
jgi:hypothetical protein